MTSRTRVALSPGVFIGRCTKFAHGLPIRTASGGRGFVARCLAIFAQSSAFWGPETDLPGDIYRWHEMCFRLMREAISGSSLHVSRLSPLQLLLRRSSSAGQAGETHDNQKTYRIFILPRGKCPFFADATSKECPEC